MRLIVIGGGAAGFFCAVTAARKNPLLEVMLLEKTGRLLSKVRVSGGGRCNVTHACFSIADMSRQYPRGENFVRKTFHQFFTSHTIDWFKERGVQLKTESDGRMFPVTDSSETIVGCLLKEAGLHDVQIRMHREVKGIARQGDKWTVRLAGGEEMESDFVCVACGGFSKASHFEWLVNVGHHFEEPVPSLFTFNMPDNPITKLMGVSTPARVRITASKYEEEGAVLITHWGISGPAVLRLSARAARDLAIKQYGFALLVNWCPLYNEQTMKNRFLEFRTDLAAQKVTNRNGLGLPQRLWEHLCALSSIDASERWAELTSVKQTRLIRSLCAQEMAVQGKTTFKEEFVTAGGIKLPEINPQTMESRIVDGLYFAGEIMDVDGVTGGFNFQHAWTSGWIAGSSIAAATARIN